MPPAPALPPVGCITPATAPRALLSSSTSTTRPQTSRRLVRRSYQSWRRSAWTWASRKSRRFTTSSAGSTLLKGPLRERLRLFHREMHAEVPLVVAIRQLDAAARLGPLHRQRELVVRVLRANDRIRRHVGPRDDVPAGAMDESARRRSGDEGGTLRHLRVESLCVVADEFVRVPKQPSH